MARTAEDLATALGLDEDMIEDVQEEMANAAKAWGATPGSENKVAFYSALLAALGSTYEESLAEELLSLEEGSQSAFTEWYIKWLFKEEEGEDDASGDDEGAAPAEGGNWSQVSWKVKPVSAPEEGVSWQCTRCRIINEWKVAKCMGCDDTAPHADTLPAPTTAAAVPVPPQSGSGFSFPSAATVPVPPQSGSGFSFPSSAVSAGTGFSFPASAPGSNPGGFSFSPPPPGEEQKGGFTFIPKS